MDNKKAIKIIENIKKVIIGKDEVIEKVLIAILARGHILIEDIPGVGKTTLAKALAKSMDLSYKRVQFTPDLMPSDIIGINIYHKDSASFSFKKGPIFNHIFLADEINRTSPKTQSSLLQAMEEGGSFYGGKGLYSRKALHSNSNPESNRISGDLPPARSPIRPLPHEIIPRISRKGL